MTVSKRTTQTNMLALIRQWSMDGARDDLEGRFGSAVDINAIVAERNEDPAVEVPAPEPPPLLMKPVGEDDWLPLLVRASDKA